MNPPTILEPVEGVDYQMVEVELDWNDNLFNRDAWRKNKLAELELNENGEPMRPGEKQRPANEQTLEGYCEVV